MLSGCSLAHARAGSLSSASFRLVLTCFYLRPAALTSLSPACLSVLQPLPPPPPPLCRIPSFRICGLLRRAPVVRPRHRLVREARLAFLHVPPAASPGLLPGTQSAQIWFKCGVKTQTWHADIRNDEDAVIKKNSERH